MLRQAGILCSARTGRIFFEAFGFTKKKAFHPAQAERSVLKYSASPSRDFMLIPSGADVFEAFGFTKKKAFRLAQAERSILKPNASLFFILSNLAGPGAPEFFALGPSGIFLKLTASPFYILSDLAGPGVRGVQAAP